jgi:hypothetical protein
MSYLEVPRLHFKGSFTADPSTINNTLSNYDPSNPLVPLWNRSGKHTFSLDCEVMSTVNTPGVLDKKDSSVNEGVTGTGKIVDLDPEDQGRSQIYGLRISVGSGPSPLVSGTMRPVAFRNRWETRAITGKASMSQQGATYTSVLTDLKWDPAITGSTGSLSKLQTINKDRLSIQLTLYAYDPTTRDGRVVGTIGPSSSTDDELFFTNCSMEISGGPNPKSLSGSSAFGVAPWRLNKTKTKQWVTIDLGNALPEVSPDGARVNQGNLLARIMDLPAGSSGTNLGLINYTKKRLMDDTAGVVDIDVSNIIIPPAGFTTPVLQLWSHSGTPKLQLIMSDRAVHMETHPNFFRLEPNKKQEVKIRVTSSFGGPVSGHSVKLAVAPTAVTPSTPLTIASATNTTDSQGVASFTLNTGSPGRKRSGIDGICYAVDFGSGSGTTPLTPSDVRGRFGVLVFDEYTAPAKPKWADVKPIFEQYARLYPAMKAMKPPLDLSNYAVVFANRAAIKAAMSQAFDAVEYMPVTRDLSPAKQAMILKWLNDGAPQ